MCSLLNLQYRTKYTNVMYIYWSCTTTNQKNEDSQYHISELLILNSAVFIPQMWLFPKRAYDFFQLYVRQVDYLFTCVNEPHPWSNEHFNEGNKVWYTVGWVHGAGGSCSNCNFSMLLGYQNDYEEYKLNCHFMSLMTKISIFLLYCLAS